MIKFPYTAIIKRTSGLWVISKERPPCDEAILKSIPLKNTMFRSTYDYWTIELKSSDDLLMLMEKYGSLIIDTEDGTNPPMLSIEIYDDYRE